MEFASGLAVLRDHFFKSTATILNAVINCASRVPKCSVSVHHESLLHPEIVMVGVASLDSEKCCFCRFNVDGLNWYPSAEVQAEAPR